jgi:AcrR family transcriptional regulator
MDRKKDITREKIVSVAKSLFGRFGPRKTTVDEIAAAAGIGKGTIYYHFNAKDEIFLEVIKREADELISRLKKTISEYSTPQGQLHAFFIARLTSLQEFLNLSWLREESELAAEPRIEQEREQLAKEEKNIIEEILHKGLEQEIFSVRDIKAAALYLLTLLRGIEFSWSLKPFGNESIDLKEMEAHIQELLNVVLQGLERRPQEEGAEV